MDNELRDAAARELVEHLRDSGAERLLLPIVVADETYEITVRHKPIADAPPPQPPKITNA